MSIMLNEQIVYTRLLGLFSNTLKETSKDDSGLNRTPPEPICFMTNCQKQVVSFDDFKKCIAKKIHGDPKSCDVLYRYSADTWFLIEFKNGKLEETNKGSFKPKSIEFYNVIRKLFESLFLLTEELGQTIEFTRKNLIFLLVYNEDKNGCLALADNVARLGRSKDILPMSHLSEILPEEPFNTPYFDRLYVKGAYICSKQSFEDNFVKQYAN